MKYNFEMVVAVDTDGCIGKSNTIPWHLPEDLQHFKELTLNHIVIMGRNTFESLPNGPLKNRLNIVISSQPDFIYNNTNVIVTNTNNVFDIIDKNISLYTNINKKVFIIGGSQIYNMFINYCSKVHITSLIDYYAHGDRYFDKSLLDNFNIHSKSDILVSKNNIKYIFCIYERCK
jgi:dihydrofolate reductase